jgi:cell division protein FtsQ
MFGRGNKKVEPRKTNSRVPTPEDVAVKTRDRRLSTRRFLRLLLAVALPTVFGVAALGGVVYAAERASQYLDDSSGFRVERIEVAGNDRLTQQAVLARAGLAPGSSIFDVDIQAAKQRLLLDPWIVRAGVEKRMPATVVVRIVERRPLAVLTGEAALHLVAEDGSVIGVARTEDLPDLPVLTGFDLERRRTDPVGLRDELESAAELLRLLAEVGLPGQRTIAEVHRSVRGGFDVIAGDGLVVHLGQGPYRDKLRRLAETSAALDERGVSPAEIFLPGARHPDRVGVRLGP